METSLLPVEVSNHTGQYKNHRGKHDDSNISQVHLVVYEYLFFKFERLYLRFLIERVRLTLRDRERERERERDGERERERERDRLILGVLVRVGGVRVAVADGLGDAVCDWLDVAVMEELPL